MTTEFKKFTNIDSLSSEDIELIEQARKAAASAYSPYSEFQVGAAVLLDDGNIILGSNQENASYPAGLCAERVALFYIGANYPDKKILKIAVTAKKQEDNYYRPATPCGICRQVMLEYEHKQKDPIQMIMQSQDGEWIVTDSIHVLLPYSFDKSNLK